MASGSPETFQPPEGALSWEPEVGRGLLQVLWGLLSPACVTHQASSGMTEITSEDTP